MAIAHDAQTRFPVTDVTGIDVGSGDRTFTHTPVGTPAGAVVCVLGGQTGICTGVLYGGVSMTLTESAVDTSEAGGIDVYVLTSGLPAGAVTVTLQNCIAAGKWATCSTVTSATNATAVNTSNSVDTTTSTSASLSLTTSDTSLSYGAAHSGTASPGNFAPLTGMTTQFQMDYGANSAITGRRTNPDAAGSITFGWSQNLEDFCAAAVALAEAAAPPPATFVPRIVIM